MFCGAVLDASKTSNMQQEMLHYISSFPGVSGIGYRPWIYGTQLQVQGASIACDQELG